HAVNSAQAPLRHLLVAKRGHPEELFSELSRLAGALCTFALDSHPRDLPLYDHRDLSTGFEKLDRHIRAHLETIVPTNCISIPLTPDGKYFYQGEVTDQRCLNRSRWIFGIRASTGDAELMSRTPQIVKVCTPPFVRELVKRALPGMVLTHLPVAPQAIPARKPAAGQALGAGYTRDDTQYVTFAAVAFLDESVLHSQNPIFADWLRKPLQEELFGTHTAGDSFFQNLQHLLTLSDSADLADVLEVHYLCLLLGFRGRYSGNPGELGTVMQMTADKIHRVRGRFEQLSP